MVPAGVSSAVRGEREGFRICEAPFRGKFRPPFEVDHGAVYKEDSGDLVWVLANERALGDPTVRLEITFVDD